MSDARYYMAIKDKKIPVIVRNYTNTNVLKIYFRGEILNISKPRNYTIDKVIKEYGDAIYKQYIEVLSPNHSYIRHWKNGESLLYKGETFLSI